MASPLGELLLVTDEAGVLRALDFTGYEDRMARLLRLHYGTLTPSPGPAPPPLLAGLAAYFAGECAALSGISWATGGTAFQQQVWTELTRIPPGQTSTYATLAARLGRPQANRAVGAANGANPIAIVLPCHRLVAANGALTGYAGGLDRKAWLLRHEATSAQNPSALPAGS